MTMHSDFAGQVAYRAGLAAEDCVAQDYARRGYPIAARRWRGSGGEIDLVARDGAGLIFVEVKKSRSFDRAAQQLRPAQLRRIQAAAAEFVAGEPNGQLTDVRVDLAMMDRYGDLRILENVTM
jgi:putative endonuclease